MEALAAARADEALHDFEVSAKLDAEAVLDLARQAGYPEDVAQKMAGQRALERQRLDLPP